MELSFTTDLDENIAMMKRLFVHDDTFICREVRGQSALRAALFFFDGMVNSQAINESIVKPISLWTGNSLQMPDVIREVYDALDNKFVISIIAGWTYEMLKDALPDAARFVRVMPNTPLAVGEGMSLISSLCTCTDEEFDFAKSVFAAAGKVAVVEDHVYTPANGISGCGPAFVCAFIEAMADGGVRYGVPRALAYDLSAQTLVGAAKMVLETGEHPRRLKDAVCSPGGTTIGGMDALEKGGMRAAVMDAVGATVEKTMRMAKK